MRVILNRWIGDHFENEFSCDRCGKLSTTVEIDDIIALCPSCLAEAQAAISEAIMAKPPTFTW
jgi:transcription elongation factor Elf1